MNEQENNLHINHNVWSPVLSYIQMRAMNEHHACNQYSKLCQTILLLVLSQFNTKQSPYTVDPTFTYTTEASIISNHWRLSDLGSRRWKKSIPGIFNFTVGILVWWSNLSLGELDGWKTSSLDTYKKTASVTKLSKECQLCVTHALSLASALSTFDRGLTGDSVRWSPISPMKVVIISK